MPQPDGRLIDDRMTQVQEVVDKNDNILREIEAMARIADGHWEDGKATPVVQKPVGRVDAGVVAELRCIRLLLSLLVGEKLS